MKANVGCGRRVKGVDNCPHRPKIHRNESLYSSCSQSLSVNVNNLLETPRDFEKVGLDATLILGILRLPGVWSDFGCSNIVQGRSAPQGFERGSEGRGDSGGSSRLWRKPWALGAPSGWHAATCGFRSKRALGCRQDSDHEESWTWL